MKNIMIKILSGVLGIIIIGLAIFFIARLQQNHDEKYPWQGSFYEGVDEERNLVESDEFKTLDECEAWAQNQASQKGLVEGTWEYSCGTGCTFDEDQIISGQRVDYYECKELITGPKSETSIANPASEYCIEQGGGLEIRTSAEGGQSGFCIFSDGSECEEWEFFRGACQPGENY